MYKFLVTFAVLCSYCQAQNIDIDILKSINPSNPNSGFVKSISSSVYPISLATPLGILAVGLLNKNESLKKQSYKIIGSLLINTAITQGLKYSIHRDRPYINYPNLVNPQYLETDASFPSGHTSTAFALATSISLQNKKWYYVVPSFLWAGSVGYSRMYLGVHYPSDVLAGAIIGAGSAFLSNWLSKKLLK
jgi:membrane-associated phospholipid phosphatase